VTRNTWTAPPKTHLKTALVEGWSVVEAGLCGGGKSSLAE